ncbi:MAG: hypothetical protein K2Q22_16465 [Cytophagales bacterium]|nr:hypothetical protein [Cytophagales bacterium]
MSQNWDKIIFKKDAVLDVRPLANTNENGTKVSQNWDKIIFRKDAVLDRSASISQNVQYQVC